MITSAVWYGHRPSDKGHGRRSTAILFRGTAHSTVQAYSPRYMREYIYAARGYICPRARAKAAQGSKVYLRDSLFSEFWAVR